MDSIYTKVDFVLDKEMSQLTQTKERYLKDNTKWCTVTSALGEHDLLMNLAKLP
jgi:hypothetical protein